MDKGRKRVNSHSQHWCLPLHWFPWTWYHTPVPADGRRAETEQVSVQIIHNHGGSASCWVCKLLSTLISHQFISIPFLLFLWTPVACHWHHICSQGPSSPHPLRHAVDDTWVSRKISVNNNLKLKHKFLHRKYREQPLCIPSHNHKHFTHIKYFTSSIFLIQFLMLSNDFSLVMSYTNMMPWRVHRGEDLRQLVNQLSNVVSSAPADMYQWQITALYSLASRESKELEFKVNKDQLGTRVKTTQASS